jgi:hypothetical protein
MISQRTSQGTNGLTLISIATVVVGSLFLYKHLNASNTLKNASGVPEGWVLQMIWLRNLDILSRAIEIWDLESAYSIS